MQCVSKRKTKKTKQKNKEKKNIWIYYLHMHVCVSVACENIAMEISWKKQPTVIGPFTSTTNTKHTNQAIISMCMSCGKQVRQRRRRRTVRLVHMFGCIVKTTTQQVTDSQYTIIIQTVRHSRIAFLLLAQLCAALYAIDAGTGATAAAVLLTNIKIL